MSKELYIAEQKKIQRRVESSTLAFYLYKTTIERYAAFWLILFPLTMDIFTGFIHLLSGTYVPFSALTRSMILIWGGYIVFKFHTLNTIVVLLTVVFYLFLFALWFYTDPEMPVGPSIKPLTFFILPMLSYIILSQCYANKIVLDKITKYMSLYGLLASWTIVFCYIIDLGYESYGDYTFGFKGVFISGNDIGICILLSSAFSWLRITQKLSFVDLIAAFSSYAGLIFIASRTGLLMGTFILIAGVISFLVLNRTKGHLMFFTKLLVSGVVAVVMSTVVWLAIKYAEDITYHSERMLDLLDGVSPRAHLEHASFEVNEHLSTVDILFGQGYSYFMFVGEEFYMRMKLGYWDPFAKIVERDFHDMYGLTGGLFTSFYIGLIVFVLMMLLVRYFKSPSILQFLVFILFVFLIAHAYFAGHVLISSQVPILVGALVFVGISNRKGCNEF